MIVIVNAKTSWYMYSDNKLTWNSRWSTGNKRRSRGSKPGSRGVAAGSYLLVNTIVIVNAKKSGYSDNELT